MKKITSCVNILLALDYITCYCLSLSHQSSVTPRCNKNNGGALNDVTKPSLSRRGFFSSASQIVATVAISTIPTPTKSAVAFSPEMIAAKDNAIAKEGISGFFAGAALSASKTLVKYPLDTASVRVQMPGTSYSISKPLQLFQGSFRGVALPLISNVPGGAIFFAAKDAAKSALVSSDTPKWIATVVAVAVALPPYWLVRNPSEVVKTRQQAGIEGYGDGVNTVDAIKALIADVSTAKNTTTKSSVTTAVAKEFYTGYMENILYAYPADVIKFLLYDQLTGGKAKNLSPLKASLCGAASTATAQLLTTPLDVVRNRAMAAKDRDDLNMNFVESLRKIAADEGPRGLFAGASPRVGKALLSGAIQFAAYEETKISIARLLDRKN